LNGGDLGIQANDFRRRLSELAICIADICVDGVRLTHEWVSNSPCVLKGF